MLLTSKIESYVPGFDYDIFVSYARVDDKPLKGIKIGWVSCLIEELEKILATYLGRIDACKLWIDKKHNQDKARLTSEILPKVKKSAFFLMILSPGYSESKWCIRELECFLKQIDTSSSEELRRIFLVQKMTFNVSLPVHLQETLEDILPYNFCYEDEEGFPLTYGLPTLNPELEEYSIYYNLLQKVSYDIVNELKRLKGEDNDSGSA